METVKMGVDAFCRTPLPDNLSRDSDQNSKRDDYRKGARFLLPFSPSRVETFTKLKKSETS